MSAGAWRHVRGGLVAAHIAAVVLGALPAPEGGMNRKMWKEPTVQGELGAWADRLGMAPDAFEDGLWTLAVGVMRGRRVALTPFQPYYRWAGTTQSWRMFVAPHKFPSRLHVDVREGGEWRSVYVQATPGEGWLEPVLEADRFRSVLFRYAWPSFGRPYDQLVDWLAACAADDFPDADQIRVRWARSRTLPPEAVRAGAVPSVQFHKARVVELAPLRAAAAE